MSPPPIDKMPMVEWSHLQSEFIWIYEARVEPEYRNLRDHLPGQSALLLRKGTLLVENNRGSVTATAGQWVFPKPGRRLQRFSDNARVLSLHFNLHWISAQPLFDWPTAIVLDSTDAPRLEALAAHLLHRIQRKFPGVKSRLPWEPCDLATHLWIQSHFSAWVQTYVATLVAGGQIPSRLGQVDHRVLDATRQLDSHPIGLPFREKQLALDVGLSVSQLDRLFFRQFGQTPSQYLDQRRLQTAISLIHQSALSIKHISYKLGFNSLAYFSRWFRNKTGFSPRQFQKMGLSDYLVRSKMKRGQPDSEVEAVQLPRTD